MKKPVTCPKCGKELKSFQVTFTTAEITYNAGYFDPRHGHVEYDEADYELVLSGLHDKPCYTCPMCANDITDLVNEIEAANWNARQTP